MREGRAVPEGPGGGLPGPPSGPLERPDRIELRGLRFVGCHGALPEEAVRAQPFEVDLDLFADLAGAGESDELAAAIDYGGLCEVVKSIVEGPHVTLLENLAERVAAGALTFAGSRAQGVMVAVRKLRPPVPLQLTSAGVRIFRMAGAWGDER